MLSDPATADRLLCRQRPQQLDHEEKPGTARPLLPRLVRARLFFLLLLPVYGSSDCGTVQELRQLTDHQATDYHPAFSPSGKEVLFTSRNLGPAALFRVPAEGGVPTRIPITSTGDLYSDWHPDGRSIVIDNREGEGPPDLYRYWLESGEIERLTNDPGMDTQPSFSPDGSRIVFMSSRAGHMDLWVMNADGAEAGPLTNDPQRDWHPRWSPDGRNILFTSDRSGDPNIWIIGPDGTGLRQLTSLPGTADRADWSPDGSRVVFQWQGDLWLVNVQGGEPQQLTDFPETEGGPAWSPDGRHIVFTDDRTGNINLWVLTVG